MSLSEQEIVRREALQSIRALGVDPYPASAYAVTHCASEIKEGYKEGEGGYEHVTLSGRLMMKRIMGKASFAELQDSSGRLQLYVNRDEICPGEDKTLYNTIFKKLLDIGDFIGVKGETFRTQVGEPSVIVKELTVLSKSIRPLPVVKVDRGDFVAWEVVHDLCLVVQPEP